MPLAPRSPSPARPADFADLRERATASLQALVRIPTVSYADAARIDAAAFEDLLAELARRYPLLHERLESTPVHTHGRLFRWPGAGGDRPVVLMAHLDVVPVDDSAPWRFPAFEARVADGSIWGRGTLDDKGSVVAICEAVERLLAEGFTPEHDVWLSFGCDEEVAGQSAPAAVEALRDLGVAPWLVLDEGGTIADEAFPGVSRPVAVIGVTEKGTSVLELSVEGRGGHSSTPVRMDTAARLARAILRLDRSPFPASAPPPTVELIRRLAPHAGPVLGALLGNAAKVPRLLTRALIAAGAEPAAMTRTTTAVTTLSGSPANNVIASSARAGVNARIMVGDSVASVVAHIRKVIRDDRVQVRVVDPGEPSPVSPMDDEAFALLESTTATVYPDAIVSPYVTMAATDARFFTVICPRVYRFSPFRMSKEQRRSLHSYDEHIGVEDLAEAVLWFEHFLRSLGKPDEPRTRS